MIPREYKPDKIGEVERIPLVAYAIIGVPKGIFGRKSLMLVDNAKTNNHKNGGILDSTN